ncbi:MAG: S8 family peptidase [Paramuribaculum sp.]|nr:S8 family peptidase [Paramuribaculum sp.]
MSKNIAKNISRWGIAGVALLSSSVVFGQTSLSMADRVALERLRTASVSSTFKSPAAQSRESSAEKKIGLLVRFENEEALDKAISKGLDVMSRYGNRAVVASSIDGIKAAASLPGVKGAGLLRRRHLLNAGTRLTTDVDRVQKGENLPKAYGGAGVYLGFFDGGIDATHINFRDADGRTRVKNLWCYPLYPGWLDDANAGIAPPDDKVIEEYLGPEAVAQFTTDDAYETHGTHVMGIAAGSFVHDEYKDFHGMAPEADMLVACGRLDDYSIMDGVTRIAQYAYESGRPCVINLSLGFNNGPHDGTDEFTAFFNDIVEQYGVSVCMAAGNEADKDISLVKSLTAEDNTVNTLTVPPGYTSGILSGFEVWSDDETPLDISLNLYAHSGNTFQKLHSMTLANDEEITYFLTADHEAIEPADSSEKVVQHTDNILSQYFTGSMICGLKGVSDMNGRYCAYFDLDLTPVQESGTKVFIGVTVKGAPGHKVFLYSPDQSLMFDSMGLAGFDEPDGNGSINSMACGRNTIAVGAYNPQVVTGAPYGKISSFSSWSDMWDGSVMPHIVAPGNSIISSISSHYVAAGMLPWGIDEVKEGDTRYAWTQRSGTSMSCPVVTGILGLWLSANPSLSPAELRDVLVSTASPAGDASKAWGAGRVNAFSGIVDVLNLNGLNSVVTDAPAIFLDTDAGYHTIACRGTARIDVEVYSLSGVLLSHHHASGDVMTLPLSACPSGTYLMKVTTDNASRTFKCKS